MVDAKLERETSIIYTGNLEAIPPAGTPKSVRVPFFRIPCRMSPSGALNLDFDRMEEEQGISLSHTTPGLSIPSYFYTGLREKFGIGREIPCDVFTPADRWPHIHSYMNRGLYRTAAIIRPLVEGADGDYYVQTSALTMSMTVPRSNIWSLEASYALWDFLKDSWPGPVIDEDGGVHGLLIGKMEESVIQDRESAVNFVSNDITDVIPIIPGFFPWDLLVDDMDYTSVWDVINTTAVKGFPMGIQFPGFLRAIGIVNEIARWESVETLMMELEGEDEEIPFVKYAFDPEPSQYFWIPRFTGILIPVRFFFEQLENRYRVMGYAELDVQPFGKKIVHAITMVRSERLAEMLIKMGIAK